MKNKVIGRVLQAPALLIMLIWVFGSAYLAWKNLQGINWAVPAILVVIVGLYFWGRVLEEKSYHKRA